jgi:hypothetical protein
VTTAGQLEGRGRQTLRRIAARRSDLAAVALLGVFVAVYLWPILFGGETFAAGSVLYLVAPWNAAPPPHLQSNLNPLLTDLPLAVYPWNLMVKTALHSGVFPSWNPRSLAGTPLFANPQTGVLAPFNIPLWVLPLTFGMSVSAALKLWCAGVGCYLLARELRLSFWPALLAGAGFVFCGYNTTWLAHETVVAVTAVLPWVIWCTERLVHRRRPVDVILLAVAVAVAIAGGHPGTAVQAVGAALLYFAVRLACEPALSRAERARVVGMALGGFVVGGLLTTVIALPTLLTGQGASGAEIRAGGGPVMPLSTLKTALFPGWWGRPDHIEFPVAFNYAERTLYAGTAALILAVAALIRRSEWRRTLPLASVGALGLAVPLGAPGVHWFVVHLPLFDMVTDNRMIFLFEFAVVMLAGFGLQSLLDAPNDQRRVWLTVAAGVAVSVVAVVAMGPSFHELKVVQNHFRTGTDYRSAHVVAMTSVAWWLIFSACVALLLVALRFERIAPTVFAVGIVAVALADAAHFDRGFQPMAPRSIGFPGETPGIRFLQRNVGPSRVAGFNHALVNGYDTTFGFRDVRGYDPPQPSKRYLRLWQIANPSQSAADPLTIDRPSLRALRVLSVLGAGWIVADPFLTRPIRGAGISVDYKGRDAIIYRNDRAAARAFVPDTVVGARGEDAALATVADRDLDTRRQAIAEPPGRSEAPASAGAGSVSISDNEDARVTLRAQMTRPGLVVLSDAWARGWSVKVDGRPATPIRANVVMRGVMVPIGSHEIEWRYRIPGFRVGALVSALTLLALVAWGVALRLRPPRRMEPPASAEHSLGR